MLNYKAEILINTVVIIGLLMCLIIVEHLIQ